MKTVKLSVATLIFDGTLYPRASLDNQHVTYLREALRSGAKMPPITVCAKTMRIADGAHRVRANQAEYGGDAKITAIVKTYANDKEFFLDAIALNADHGRALTSYDRSHIAIIAKNLKINPEHVASTLHMTITKFDSLVVDRSATLNRTPTVIPLKRTIRHMSGGRLTQRQQEANVRLGGMNQTFYVNQLITLMENDLLDTENANLMARLEVLRTLLAKIELAVA